VPKIVFFFSFKFFNKRIHRKTAIEAAQTPNLFFNYFSRLDQVAFGTTFVNLLKINAINPSLPMENTAFNDTLCTHHSCLESFARRFTQDLEDANDLVQDTLIKAIRYHNLYKPGTNMRGWLYTIMKNTFINDYRRGSRKNAIMQNTEEFTPEHLSLSATGNTGENTFIRKDIQTALDRLQPGHSVPFLRYFEGYKYHEIAEELGIPIGTVKTRIHMARKELKKYLKMYQHRYQSEHQSALT
jgi:RNA polymerase sigma-70 factor (ECF subfamily)